MQDAAGRDAGGVVVAVAADKEQMRGGGEMFGVGFVLGFAVHHAFDDDFRQPARQVGRAQHGVADAVVVHLAVFPVIAYPAQQFVFEGGVVHLYVVTPADSVAQLGEGRRVAGEGMNVDVRGCFRQQDLQDVIRHHSPIAGRAVSLAARDAGSERIGG